MIRRARKIDKEEIDKLYKDWNENYGHDDLTSCFFDRFDQGLFENNNTASRIIQSGLEFPFIITGGRPTEACHILLERLVETGVKLLYQGDIDKAGIDMADLLKAKYPELETPFMTTTVFDKYALLSKGKEQNYLLKKTKSVGLKAMIEQTGKAVYEEQLDLQEHYLYWVAENSLAQKNVDY